VLGFTTRQPGEFNLNYSVARAPRRVARNRRRLLRALGGRWQFVTLKQRHTDTIQVLRKNSRRNGVGRARRERDGAVKLTGDALITDRPGLLLAVQVADCLPILLFDAEKRVVAAVHAGWRGTAKRIAEKAVGRMRAEFGSNPKKLRAVIGPGIHGCCYEVGRDVVEAFDGQFPYAPKLFRRIKPAPPDMHWQQRLFSPEPPQPGERRPRPGVTAAERAEKFYLDLVEANRRQLLAAGLRTANVAASPLCTACRTDLLFSHRAEQGQTGRMMGWIGIAVMQTNSKKPRKADPSTHPPSPGKGGLAQGDKLSLVTKPRLDKLGVKPGARVAVLGVEEKAFARELRKRTRDVTQGRAKKSSDLIFLAAESPAGLKRLRTLQRALKPNGALWVVWPKGRPALKESQIIAAGIAAGLIDNKVVSFSKTHSALRLVIPLARR